MACGPTGASKQPAERSEDAFSFSSDPMMAAGFGAFALFWAAPFRAACVIAGEALREGTGRRD